MIIQCEQCQTKFRLDDSKVTGKGVKVRCAKCRHVFSVTREQPETGQPPEHGAISGQAAPSERAVEESATFAARESAPVPDSDSTFGEFDFGEAAGAGDTAEFHPTATVPEPPAGIGDFDFGADAEQAVTSSQAPSPPMPEDSFAFDFGEAEETPQPAAPQKPDSSAAEAEPGFDFGDESIFGSAVAAPASEEPSTPITFDFQMDEFADSMGVESASGASGTAMTDMKADEPFSLDEIDFGDELSAVAVQQVNPDELKPAQDLFFSPLAETQEKHLKVPFQDIQKETTPGAPEELPPLSIASRRKQGPMFTILISLVGVVLLGVLGYFGYAMFAVNKVQPGPEAGKISVRSVTASYVKNKAAGEMLVITGEALNEYREPRAAIQVKGMVYGADGRVLASKTAYAGNPLTVEQLATLPPEKIEAAMANQFGDSLANLEVAVGKAIPFVIAISSLPAGARDLGVEAAGSTVATGKQQ